MDRGHAADARRGPPGARRAGPRHGALGSALRHRSRDPRPLSAGRPRRPPVPGDRPVGRAVHGARVREGARAVRRGGLPRGGSRPPRAPGRSGGSRRRAARAAGRPRGARASSRPRPARRPRVPTRGTRWPRARARSTSACSRSTRGWGQRRSRARRSCPACWRLPRMGESAALAASRSCPARRRLPRPGGAPCARDLASPRHSRCDTGRVPAPSRVSDPVHRAARLARRARRALPGVARDVRHARANRRERDRLRAEVRTAAHAGPARRHRAPPDPGRGRGDGPA